MVTYATTGVSQARTVMDPLVLVAAQLAPQLAEISACARESSAIITFASRSMSCGRQSRMLLSIHTSARLSTSLNCRRSSSILIAE